MKTKEIVLFGIGPISRTIFYACRQSGQFQIAGFTADRTYITEKTLCGLPIVPFEEVHQHYRPESYDMLVVNVGSVAGTISRKTMFLRAKEKGYRLVNYIDHKASVADDVVMGENNIVMFGAHVGPSGKMADNNFVRENMYLGHDCQMGSHNFLGPGCNIGGFCQIGDLNFIGMGSTVINTLEIGTHNLIGAGALVIKPIDSFGKYVGNPARWIAAHTPAE